MACSLGFLGKLLKAIKKAYATYIIIILPIKQKKFFHDIFRGLKALFVLSKLNKILNSYFGYSLLNRIDRPKYYHL